MTSKSKTKSVALSQPWEDALIVALRDLQWIRKNKAVLDEIRRYGKAATDADKAAIKEQVGDLPVPPALLAKLDGNAESASGDILTSAEKRFFLLELKASEAGLGSEKAKFVYSCLESVDPENEEDRALLELSRRGHHVLYPVVEPASNSAPSGFLPVHRVTLTTRTYYDAVAHGADAAEAITASDLLWNRRELGLRLHEMAAYLDALSSVHKGSATSHPIKVVVTSAGEGSELDNFVWPYADLSQFVDFAAYFDKAVENSATDKLYRRLKSQLAPTVARLLATRDNDENSRDEDISSPAP
ncbi:hypothetical protein [Burkholderia pseudomallei]|uniref:hypothetical protein n=1 Tax=Burkholderia pseudomallei TaxID=28450 RepID=UPI000A719488|nr:hypothetical protein [Burkholderia pseudomallei]MBF3380595.1 hypothetical protein [Burkholderia pseudomallei]MBF3402807.1 hypothetical protein [Burkholderia pseudomallei]CAJ9572981.1 Uncharacterised protein [Burkholderia pseudomallei]VCQ90461.1 Uncharacterised protein [Burkholderia pseudomallei]